MTKPYAPDDPSMLVGTAVPDGDMETMAASIVEEYVRMGMDDRRLWRLFRSPAFRLTNMVLRAKGEEFVETLIHEARTRWGYPQFREQGGRDG